jgi:ankyrin repeat protein
MDSSVLSTSRGWSHLHDLCSGISHPSEKHWESLLSHIERFAEEAAEKDEFGHTPLHLLLRHNPPLAVVAALYEAYKDALCQAEDKTGYLPLHVACLMGCNVDVVRFLIEKYPHALGHCAMRRHRYRWWEKRLCPRDLVLKLPKTNPNRQHLVEVIDDFEDDIDVEDNRKVRHSRSIWKYDLGWTDRRQRADIDADVVDSQ